MKIVRLMLVLALAGCGQSGDLFIPTMPELVTAPATSSAPVQDDPASSGTTDNPTKDDESKDDEETDPR